MCLYITLDRPNMELDHVTRLDSQPSGSPAGAESAFLQARSRSKYFAIRTTGVCGDKIQPPLRYHHVEMCFLASPD